MNARMYVSDLLLDIEQPTIKHGWAAVFASPEAAAIDHDPTAVQIQAPTPDDEYQTSRWQGASGEFVIRGWLELHPFQPEPVVDGYLYDSWQNSRLEYEGILQ